MEGGNNLLLEVHNLKTYFYLDEGILKAVDEVNITIKKGETLGLVGESGCGKSVTAQSILRIVPSPGKIVGGKILFYHQFGNTQEDPINLARLHPSGRKIRAIRGKDITMIFQEPMTSFSPVHTIGNQITEAILLHRTKDKKEAREITIEMLGGMRQRAMIAMALSCNPSLLIADEPTTALDVTVQAQVLELMKDLQTEFGMSILFITHNLGVIAEMSDEVAVMYLGKIVEYASVEDIFYTPLHPYTQALLKSIPKVGKKAHVRLESIEGVVPLPLDLPQGCTFYSRCQETKKGICNKENPPLIEVKKNHKVRCFRYT